MENSASKARRFGLVGRNIDYSFSRTYFAEKFRRLQLEHCTYQNFDLPEIGAFPALLEAQPDLCGLNVTIPYKEAIIPFLLELHPVAAAIGAVNTIAFTPDGLVGHNTDAFGFRESLIPHLHPRLEHALVLGTGGASKAIGYVLEELGLPYQFVSRKNHPGMLSYQQLEGPMRQPCLVINCTPLGTYPNTEAKPPLPYPIAGKDHLFFDLIYNPEETAFMKAARAAGATALNGRRMLELQADQAWEIWNA